MTVSTSETVVWLETLSCSIQCRCTASGERKTWVVLVERWASGRASFGRLEVLPTRRPHRHHRRSCPQVVQRATDPRSCQTSSLYLQQRIPEQNKQQTLSHLGAFPQVLNVREQDHERVCRVLLLLCALNQRCERLKRTNLPAVTGRNSVSRPQRRHSKVARYHGTLPRTSPVNATPRLCPFSSSAVAFSYSRSCTSASSRNAYALSGGAIASSSATSFRIATASSVRPAATSAWSSALYAERSRKTPTLNASS